MGRLIETVTVILLLFIILLLLHVIYVYDTPGLGVRQCIYTGGVATLLPFQVIMLPPAACYIVIVIVIAIVIATVTVISLY